jgi:sugar phosphate isomerase/epimerase
MGAQPFGYCLNTSTIRCGEMSLEEKVAVAAEAGYDGIEPWVNELEAYVAQGGDLRDLGQRMRDAGLTPVNLIGFFEWAVPDEERRRQAWEEARRCFEMAQRLGCRHVAAPPSGIHTLAGLDLFAVAERYAALIDLARDFGVVPILEFWGIAQTLGHLGEALLVASECGRPEACILADVFHIYKSSGHFQGLRLLGPHTLGLFHFNDYPAHPPREQLTDADRVYPGDGVAPLREILQTLHRIGYRGMLSLELFNRTYWSQDALTVARTGLEKMKASVEAAGLESV